MSGPTAQMSPKGFMFGAFTSWKNQMTPAEFKPSNSLPQNHQDCHQINNTE